MKIFTNFRIQQLENTVEILNSKLNLTFKRCQLTLLKHETAPSGSDVTSTIRLPTNTLKSPHILKKAELNGAENFQNRTIKKLNEEDYNNKKNVEQSEECLVNTRNSQNEPSGFKSTQKGPRVILPQYVGF